MDLQLTPSQENYLEHIWHLSSQKAVRVVDVAESVGVKRPSVTRAVNILASLGLVKHEHYKGIEFTPKGYRTAQYIVRRDRSLKRFLTQVLHLDSKMADEEVCRIEHAVSAEVLKRLDILASYISRHAALQKELGQEMKPITQSANSKKTVSIAVKLHV